MRSIILVLAFIPSLAFAQSYSYNTPDDDHGQAAAIRQDEEHRQAYEAQFQQEQASRQMQAQQVQLHQQQQQINNYNSASPIERLTGNY